MNNSLDQFVEIAQDQWAPLCTATVNKFRGLVSELVKTSADEPWLSEALKGFDGRPSELYRDAERGFVLMGYREKEGTFWPPHDHGNGWVVYAVYEGEMEMGDHRMFLTGEGKVNLVQRNATRMAGGDVSVYLPGDIHHTRCLSETAVIFRFASCDLAKETQAGRMVRFLNL